MGLSMSESSGARPQRRTIKAKNPGDKYKDNSD